MVVVVVVVSECLTVSFWHLQNLTEDFLKYLGVNWHCSADVAIAIITGDLCLCVADLQKSIPFVQ